MVSLLQIIIAASVLAFLLGVAAIPLYAYILQDGIPIISPMVGRLLFVLASVGNGANVLNYREDDRYEMLAADTDEYGPSNYWTRFALTPFGVAFERTERAFGNCLRELDLDHMREESAEKDKLPGERHPIDIERGGMKTYVRTTLDPDAYFVAVGEKLAELRDSAGIAVPNRTHMEALKDHGGDSKEFSVVQMGVITFAFTVLGFGATYMVVFGL